MELKEIKKILASDDSLYLETKNLEKGYTGVASFHTNGEEKIIVFEGDPSGSDDASYTYNDFLKKYSFEIKKELE